MTANNKNKKTLQQVPFTSGPLLLRIFHRENGMSSPEHLSRSEGERPPGQVTCGHLLDTRVGTASWDPGRHQGPVKAAAGAVSDAFHKNKPHTKDGKKKNPQPIKPTRCQHQENLGFPF